MKFEEKGLTTRMDSSQFPTRPGDLPSAKVKSTTCGLSGCSEPATVSLDSRSLCLDHLVSHCYSRLQECEQGEGFEPIAAGARIQTPAANFLEECHSKIASLLVVRAELTNIERARLLDILLWASELTEKQKRRWSNRRAAAGMQTDS
jgi:hypothetical protein